MNFTDSGNTNTALNLEDMAIVNGGTFTSNKFPEWCYQRAGFTTNFHFFARDEFILNGITYHEDEANAIMEQKGWKIVKVGSNRKGCRRFIKSKSTTLYYCNGVEQHQ